jgi:hypothetical protein
MKVCRSCEVFNNIFWSPLLSSSWLPAKNLLESSSRWIRGGRPSTYSFESSYSLFMKLWLIGGTIPGNREKMCNHG